MKGTILGTRYEIIEKIGEGGMSEVYKAKCHLLNRFVAIKILKKEFANDEEFVEKFKREAASSAALACNNIINIYDVGSENGINYIVMELVTGKTLKEIINEQGRIEIGKAIDYSIQICKALDCAHKNNIIHRDIKPQNIMVTEEGIIKVADFGIAKAADYNNNTITNTSKVMGSAHYFSPEQAKGSYVDCRTDIYSLGIVMYEMLVGKLPYDADSAVSVALKHIQEEPMEPIKLNPAIYKGLNDIVLKAMEKDPANRYSSIKEMLSDLKNIKENPYYQIKKNDFNEDFTKAMDVVDIAAATGATMEHTMITDRLPLNSAKKDNKFYEDTDIDEENDEEEDDLPVYAKKEKRKKVGFWVLISVMILIIGISSAFLYKMFAGGSNTIAVPSLVGVSKTDAEKKLKDLGLILEVTGEEDSDKPKDTILEITPKSGAKLKKGDKVKAIVSNGGEKIELSDFKGMTLDDVKVALKEKGLKLGKVEKEPSDGYNEGEVISQNPKAGTKVSKGDTINLVVSSGAKEKTVKVPGLTGKTIDEAKNALNDANLKLGSTTEQKTDKKDQDGKIFSQSISEGSDANEGTSINVSYYKFDEESQKIDVPDLSGQTLDQAKNTLKGQGLTLGGSSEDYSTDFAKGQVMSQNPAQGSKIQKGQSVSVVISKGQKEETVEVPGVVGNDLEGAKSAIINAGLQVGGANPQEVTEQSQDGKIISQNPAEGTKVKKGTSVSVSYGKYKSNNNSQEPPKEEKPKATSFNFIKDVRNAVAKAAREVVLSDSLFEKLYRLNNL